MVQGCERPPSLDVVAVVLVGPECQTCAAGSANRKPHTQNSNVYRQTDIQTVSTDEAKPRPPIEFGIFAPNRTPENDPQHWCHCQSTMSNGLLPPDLSGTEHLKALEGGPPDKAVIAYVRSLFISVYGEPGFSVGERGLNTTKKALLNIFKLKPKTRVFGEVHRRYKRCKEMGIRTYLKPPLMDQKLVHWNELKWYLTRIPPRIIKTTTAQKAHLEWLKKQVNVVRAVEACASPDSETENICHKLWLALKHNGVSVQAVVSTLPLLDHFQVSARNSTPKALTESPSQAVATVAIHNPPSFQGNPPRTTLENHQNNSSEFPTTGVEVENPSISKQPKQATATTNIHDEKGSVANKCSNKSPGKRAPVGSVTMKGIVNSNSAHAVGTAIPAAAATTTTTTAASSVTPARVSNSASSSMKRRNPGSASDITIESDRTPKRPRSGPNNSPKPIEPASKIVSPESCRHATNDGMESNRAATVNESHRQVNAGHSLPPGPKDMDTQSTHTTPTNPYQTDTAIRQLLDRLPQDLLLDALENLPLPVLTKALRRGLAKVSQKPPATPPCPDPLGDGLTPTATPQTQTDKAGPSTTLTNPIPDAERRAGDSRLVSGTSPGDEGKNTNPEVHRQEENDASDPLVVKLVAHDYAPEANAD